MAIVLDNAILADFDPINVERGSLRIDNGRIVARDNSVSRETQDEVIDCGGAVVLPGLVNGHAHLYSALAAGMPAPPTTPTNFVEQLQYVWWRLDRALDATSIEMSGRIGALDAVRCGTTTLIDHHASPTCIDCSLDFLERGIADVGPRAVLCYETTDRNGKPGREAGIEENHRYLEKLRAEPNQRFAGLVGAHASFTLDDETLTKLGELVERFGSGVHIHVAEDPADERDCREKHDCGLVDRLAAHNLLTPPAVFAHCTHLDVPSIERLNEVGVIVAHNARSNMNNGVGYTPIGQFKCPIVLGTDGIGSDMFTEARHAWFKSCDAHVGMSPNDFVGMLANAARRASQSLGVTLGKLAEGAAADVVITDFRPATPLHSDNFAGQFIFALSSPHVASVLIDGQWAMRDRKIVTCDEADIRRASRDIAAELWDRMAGLS